MATKIFNFFPICRLNSLNRVFIRNTTAKSTFFTSAVPNSEKKLEKPGVKIKKIVTPDGDVVEVKKKIYQERVTLYGTDNSIQIVTPDEANKIAKRRNLKLVQVTERDPKTDRAVYKLQAGVAGGEIKVTKENSKNLPKSEKLMTITSKISDYDLKFKINHILKWLQKENTVKVTITGDAVAAENVFSKISESTKEHGRIPQKVFKGGEIRFQILLPKKQKVRVTEDTNHEEDK